jgi:hypothetical protein
MIRPAQLRRAESNPVSRVSDTVTSELEEPDISVD